MEGKNYDRRSIQGIVSSDFEVLTKLGNLKKVSMGKYRIVDKEIYKDNKDFLDTIEKFRNGEKLVLA